MASNSATKLATQQSIKAYVDSAVSAGSAVALTDIGSFILGRLRPQPIRLAIPRQALRIIQMLKALLAGAQARGHGGAMDIR